MTAGVLVAVATPAAAAIPAASGDVFAISTQGGSGTTEVHAFKRSDGYHSYSVQTATGLHVTDLATWTFGIGDYNGDRIPDLYAVDSKDNGGANTAVHIYSGASNLTTALLHKRLPNLGGTSLSQWQFFVGDYNGDNRGDLYAIDSRDNGGLNTAVHIWNAGDGMSTFLLHKRLPGMGPASLDTWTFAAGDYNGDRRADLFGVNTRDNGGLNTAAHVLNAADGMSTYLLHKRLPGMGPADLKTWAFSTGDHNLDYRADLVAVNSNDPGSGKTAVHVLDGASALATYTAHSVSPMNPVSLTTWQFHGWTGPSWPTRPILVIGEDFPDPDIIKVGETWYAYATNGPRGHVPVASAPSPLGPWTIRGDAMPRPAGWSDGWSNPGRTWAPDVSFAGGRYVLTYTAQHAASGRQCIGLALSSSPLGPFRPHGGQPFICPTGAGGAIDANAFVDNNGTRYLLYKNDGNAVGADTWIYLQRLTSDGLNHSGAAARLIRQDRASEAGVIEAPVLVKRPTKWVLFYSAGCYCDSRYHTGYATSGGITGPYTKSSSALMTTQSLDNVVSGPGGADVLGGHIFFHGWISGNRRGMYVTSLAWSSDNPVVRG